MRSIRLVPLIIAALALATLHTHEVKAQPPNRSFGFGLIVGEPTGITFKGSAGGSNAWDGAIGSSWFGRLRLHADYLWLVNAFNSRKVGMYFGLGAAVGIGRGSGILIKGHGKDWYYYEDEDAIAVGARVSAGINAMPFTAPVEIFFEIAPVIGLVPRTGLNTDVALGIRYYP